MSSQRTAVVALGVTAFVAVAAIAGFAYWYYPRTVENAAQLDERVGCRIALTAVFDGDDKAYDLLYFDGVTLRVHHVTGSFEWPKTGQTIFVTGRLERNNYPPEKSRIPYVVRDARWKF
jgi:hypothetical protein